jgi:hypothetical protein
MQLQKKVRATTYKRKGLIIFTVLANLGPCIPKNEYNYQIIFSLTMQITELYKTLTEKNQNIIQHSYRKCKVNILKPSK